MEFGCYRLRLESRLRCVRLFDLDSEPIVERLPWFDYQRPSAAVHRDRELVEEAVLSEQNRPSRLPTCQETDIGVPLTDRPLTAFEQVFTQLDVNSREGHMSRTSADPKRSLNSVRQINA